MRAYTQMCTCKHSPYSLLVTVYIHDVMHDVVIAIMCVVRMRSGAWTACCAVLSWSLIGLLFPVP